MEEIVKKLGRKPLAISSKAHSLDMKRTERFNGKFWTEEQIEDLKKVYSTNISKDELCLRFGRNFANICGKANNLHLRREMRFWSEEKIELLKILWVSNLSTKEIAEKIGHNIHGIYSKASCLKGGFCNLRR